MKLSMNAKDFMCDDLFIYWRTHPTNELNVFWEHFLNDNKHLTTPFHEAVELFEALRNEQNTPPFDESLLKQLLTQRIRMQKKKKIRRIFWPSSAAVFLLALISTLFILKRSTKELTGQMTSIGRVMNENSVRFIAGNDVLEMDNNSTLTLSEKKNSAIVQDSASQKEIDLKGNQINRLIVPFGKRSSVILADGSTVHINSGTEIEFPTTFPGHAREIDVKGEIFIEVVKKENAPFIIHTPNSQITVYGTSFNVSSYLDEKNESIVLVSGFVEVKSENNSIMLKPNEMAQIENGIVARKKVNVSEYISWRNGYMELNKTPLNDVLKKIGRYYNVEFQYGNELNLINETCSGKLFLSENLNDVLEAFSKMTYYHYDKQSDKAIFIHK